MIGSKKGAIFRLARKRQYTIVDQIRSTVLRKERSVYRHDVEGWAMAIVDIDLHMVLAVMLTAG
ncbi:hypothetical protein [Sphingobacterium sp. SYP-B4668]|uniref:hypothetical protein n=1 Tax=Sphingobacterium sp. SYP-B4668 TaxID=2996035 RepID=UPI0022DCF605|nr:hypothetical protein [Sphingobacterium sp. SYP-B4668]